VKFWFVILGGGLVSKVIGILPTGWSTTPEDVADDVAEDVALDMPPLAHTSAVPKVTKTRFNLHFIVHVSVGCL
jgi:hypothetical protein